MIDDLLGTSLDRLYEERVDGDHKSYSFGRSADLEKHVVMLRDEFVGQRRLLLYHAVLTTLIRRKIDINQNIARFDDVWRSHGATLITELDSRWLVSACDTIIDHTPDGEERAFALCAVLFANTVKLYETERIATGEKERAPPYALPPGRVALHDGMSGFMIGRGDMIANLRKRIDVSVQGRGTAASILAELVRRSGVHDTVFRRFAQATVTP